MFLREILMWWCGVLETFPILVCQSMGDIGEAKEEEKGFHFRTSEGTGFQVCLLVVHEPHRVHNTLGLDGPNTKGGRGHGGDILLPLLG